MELVKFQGSWEGPGGHWAGLSSWPLHGQAPALGVQRVAQSCGGKGRGKRSGGEWRGEEVQVQTSRDSRTGALMCQGLGEASERAWGSGAIFGEMHPFS